MPTRTRGSKTARNCKENISKDRKAKSKPSRNANQVSRKPLADKTNSASDDNLSSDFLNENVPNAKAATIKDQKPRPRRDRRLPSRYKGNTVLINLSNSQEVTPLSENDHSTPSKLNKEQKGLNNNIKNRSISDALVSPSKTPEKNADNRLIVNRPKRICRLPSKFEDHSISPNKFVSVVQPCHASTPIQINNMKSKVTKTNHKTEANKTKPSSETIVSKGDIPKTNSPVKRLTRKKTTPDTNNNAKNSSKVETKAPLIKTALKSKGKNGKSTADKNADSDNKVTNVNFSFRVLEDKKTSEENKQQDDIYEFTFDPNEEPAPQKKKRKKPVVKRKPAKPRTVVIKSNYDANLMKTLTQLKNTVKSKQILQTPNLVAIETESVNVATNTPQTNQVTEKNPLEEVNAVKNKKDTTITRIEDIAADFDENIQLNYSPVASPHHDVVQEPQLKPPASTDPLNLQDDISFFGDDPVASSSMNVSARHPQASPWRVEFNELPIKWHVNSYVKPDLTPAFECSYFNNEESKKKKHVYTNLVPESNEPLPEIFDKNTSSLRQTSILSFIKEVTERNLNKKKKGKVATPTKCNSIFDVTNISPYNTPEKPTSTPTKENTSNNSDSATNDKENSREALKRKHSKDLNAVPFKTPRKDKDANSTLFGFDDSENNSENISPKKNLERRVRSLRPRGVLQELNQQAGPTRAVIPSKLKFGPSSDVVNRIYEELKAMDAPILDKNVEKPSQPVDTTDASLEEQTADDEESVHLFEDIDVVHHVKPIRKSYGKSKVRFNQNSNSDDDDISDKGDEQENSDSEDDLQDLTFELPKTKKKRTLKKKPTKKEQITKKEEAEVEAWAAGFNSMCEDIDGFDLIVE